MKVTATVLMLLVLFLPNIPAQEFTQWHLPEGAVARLGKGSINAVQYSPDGSRLAVATSIGIWFYDTTTGQEVALLTDHTEQVTSVAFSPDGATLASTSGIWGDNMARLWDTTTGELQRTLTEHTSTAFSEDGETLANGSQDNAVHEDSAVYLDNGIP